MRYTVSRAGVMKPTPAVAGILKQEKEQRIHVFETYRQFAVQVDRSRQELLTVLRQLKKDRRRVVGYAATSKSTTVLNYCGIPADLIEFICDTTPTKHGTFSPGMHIPVQPYHDFQANYPDYALLFAWNHAEEIMKKETRFMQSGGGWIQYVPKVQMSSHPREKLD
jgi:methylation protein EvaC